MLWWVALVALLLVGWLLIRSRGFVLRLPADIGDDAQRLAEARLEARRLDPIDPRD